MRIATVFMLTLLSGCVGYSNTSKMQTDIETTPYDLQLPDYLVLENYTMDDVRKINQNNRLIAEAVNGGISYLEYSVSRAGRPQWTGFAVLLPILVPKLHQFGSDNIKYVFHNNKLSNIEYDYYKTHDNIRPLVPIDCFGHGFEPRNATVLQSERPLTIDFSHCGLMGYKYKDAFFTNAPDRCDANQILSNDNSWDIYGMKMPALIRPTLVPKQFKLKDNEYYDTQCVGDNCTSVVCSDNVCQSVADVSASRLEYDEQWAFSDFTCGQIPALGIQGLRFSYDDNSGQNKKTYTIQAINNPTKNYDSDALLKYIDYEPSESELPRNTTSTRISHTIQNTDINNINMTIINTLRRVCTPTCKYHDVYKAVFFNNANIYYVQMDFENTDTLGHDANMAEFKQFLSMISLDK